MKVQLLSLLCLVALVVAEDNLPGELDLEYTAADGTKEYYPSRKDDQLYHEIAVQRFDNALDIAREFINDGQSEVITKVIDHLVENRRTYVAAFAFKLFAHGHRDIVENHFPIPYRMIFDDSLIKFTNNLYNLPIEYSRGTDRDGDYGAYGKENTINKNQYIWKLDPVVDGKSVYFKIRNSINNIYLKLGVSMDGDGDYQAYGSTNSDTHRHQWMFQPVNSKGQLSFCIINRAHYHALKLSESVSGGDRKIYASYGDFYNYPDRFGWRIDIKSDKN